MPAANRSDFLGEGVTGGVAGAYDPDDQPNPANPGGISNNELRRRQAAAARPAASGFRGAPSAPTTDPAAAARAFQNGNVGGAAGAYNAVSDRGRAAFDASHQSSRSGVLPALGAAVRFAVDPIGGAARAVAGPAAQALTGPAGAATVGVERTAQAANQVGGSGTAAPRAPTAPAGGGVGGTRGLPASPADAGIAPPVTPPANPAAGVPNTAGPAPAPVTVDRTQYDAAAADLRATRDLFQTQLQRLSGLDPFGNQAFMQKATDRAVAQAAGTAAGAMGGGAAIAGAQRAAVGVQAQLAARGAQDVAEQGRRDAVQAAGLGIETVKGIESVNSQLASNEIALTDRLNQAAELNIRQYLGGRELDQSEKDSVRRFSAEVAKIDQQRYATDVGYREAVNANLTAMYQSDNALKGALAAVEAGENLSGDEWLMGIMGLGAGLAQGVAMKSDRRSKKGFAPAKARDLKEFLGSGKGEFYEYRSPDAPGQRRGQNYGPMAQDLRKSKIGRTVVVEGNDGLYVDTGRLALADHSALSHLAARVERLARRVGESNGKKR